MKKSLIVTLVFVFVFGLTGTAFAGPFADVPAKHWSYDAVSKLAKAGIISGYGDGSFRGDKTMTRYEMAQIVATAMERSDKADAENKALINKLADEYAQELDNLGVRVTKLENKVGNIKFSGQVREWYQWADKPAAGISKSDEKTRLLLMMNAPLTDDLSFVGRFWAESNWGENSAGTGATTAMDQAYLVGKNFTLGRQPITLGKGLVYNWGADQDGVTVTVGNKVKVTAAAFKHNTYDLAGGSADLNYLAANVAAPLNDNLDMTLVYAKTKKADLTSFNASTLNTNLGSDQELLNTWAVGFGYKGIQNVGVTAEYGQNTSDAAKAVNNNDTAKAWVAQAKYLGADWTKPHTWGFWVGYRKADNGFFGRTGDPLWETAYNIPGGYLMNNVKGADYGFEYTVFNNAVFTLNYLDLKDNVNGDTNKKNFTAQLRYAF